MSLLELPGPEDYADASDVMGSGGFCQVNAPHKDQMGWLPSSKIVLANEAAVFSSDGDIFKIAPLELLPESTAYPQTVKFTVANGYPYYVSFRRRGLWPGRKWEQSCVYRSGQELERSSPDSHGGPLRQIPPGSLGAM